MATQQPIDPLAQQVAKFVADFYLPRIVRIIRRGVSAKSLGWIALAGALIVVPIAVAAVMRSAGERASNRRYDTADYLSDDLA